MDSTLLDLARRAVACGGWRVLDGMRLRRHTGGGLADHLRVLRVWFFNILAVDDGPMLHEWTWEERQPTREAAEAACEAEARRLGVIA